MHTDTLLYRLFQERPATLFDLAGLDGDGSGYRLTAVEVKETAFRLDGVLLPPPDAAVDAPLLFLENQFQGLAQFYARWLAAIFLTLYRQQIARPWLAIAVFPTRAVEPLLGPAFNLETAVDRFVQDASSGLVSDSALASTSSFRCRPLRSPDSNQGARPARRPSALQLVGIDHYSVAPGKAWKERKIANG